MSSSRDQVVAAAESYVRGLGERNLAAAALDPDVIFESPISPPRRGAADVTGFLSGLFPHITGATVIDHIVEGAVCATRFDLHLTSGASLHVFDRFEVRDGRVLRINPYYDPAPLHELLAATNTEQGGQQ